MTDTARALSNNRKKQGVVKASLTRLSSRLDAVERLPDPDEVRRLTILLETLSAEFKVHHYSIIDLLDYEVELAEQQEILDEHDDYVSQLTARLEKVVTICSSKDSNQPRISFKRLMNIEKGLIAILDGTSSIPSGDDGICLLQ